MVGAYHIAVQNSIVKYEFDIKRNITIIKGDSATGKTVLVDMIQEYILNGSDSGITVSCDVPCRVIEGHTWEEQLAPIKNSIVFIDEGNRFVCSDDFSEHVKRGDNYYVIVTREKLANLPYSVTEIYGIHSSGKYENLAPVYHELYRIYDDREIHKKLSEDIIPTEIIVEDTNAGYEFFSYVTEKANSCKCISAGGKSNVFNTLQTTSSETILIIADGAAFGCEMERLYELLSVRSNVHLYLPESFEWLILHSDVIPGKNYDDFLEHTELYAESSKYMSWERYYTALLTESTKQTRMAYNKRKLNPTYKNTTVKTALLKIMQGIKIIDNTQEDK